METFVVYFRGINIGGHNILPIAELITPLNQLRFDNIRKYIQSGEVVFDSRLSGGIRKLIKKVPHQNVGRLLFFKNLRSVSYSIGIQISVI